MMGLDQEDLLKNKIAKMDEETSQVTKKRIDTMDFKRQREVMTVGGGTEAQKDDKYIWESMFVYNK